MIDLHVDCVLQRRLLGYDITRSHRALLPGQPFIWHSDLPRMIEAGYQGVCLGVHYFPWQSEAAWRELNVQLDYIDEVVAADPRCLRVRESADWQRARDAGKLAVSAGIEGAHMLNGELSRVEALAARGISYMTLAHFGVNDAVTPSWGRGSNERDGLTGWGRELVAELERHRVWIDVAHVNTPGVLDGCAIAKRPAVQRGLEIPGSG